jgi:hypothetical protein
MAVQIQLRRGLAAEWTLSNPILAEGEMGVETDTSLFKIGDGEAHWRDLQYGGLRGTTGYVGSLGNIAVQNVLYVSKSGNDDNDGRSLNTSKLTIKAALAIATYGTTIFVKSGVYTEDSPLLVPPHVAVVGDSLRTVTVRPLHPERDLFYVNNGCYLAHMAFRDHVSPAAAVAFPADGSAGVIIQSPYVQNCTSFSTSGTGMRIDGNLSKGTKSMVVDAYTQYNQGGIGIHLLNRGYAQLVSVFTIACDKGFFAESGGFCSITNSNSSFGNYALYADGVSEPFQTAYVSTNTRTTVTLKNVTSRPGIGDAIKFSSTTTYYTVSTSSNLRIGNTPVTNPTISNESAILRNARTSVLSRKSQIQAETIVYLNETYPDFQFNQFKCNRDIATILDCVLYDMILGSNYQSVAAGIAYTRAQSYVITATQLTETLSAIQFVKNFALSTISSGTAAYTRLFDNFDVVLGIIENGASSAPAINYPNPSVISTSTIIAKNQLIANKDFIRAETIEYVSRNFVNFTYDKVKCARDTGLIIDGLITDLIFAGNGYTQSNFAGLQYWNQAGYTGAIPAEINTTTNAIRYISSLSQRIVQNVTTGTRYQNTVTQVLGTATTLYWKTQVNNEFDAILTILTSGTANVTNEISSPGLIPVSDSAQHAYDTLQANKSYIQAEGVAWVEANRGFTYDQAKCYRDTGLIVDSLAFDLLYNGTSQSAFAGLQYWSQNGYTGEIARELTTTSNAIAYVRDTIASILTTVTTTATVASVVSNFNEILYILNTGTAAVTDAIVPNGVTKTASTIIAAYNSIIANKTLIQNQTISWINSNNIDFVYNTSTCYRDVGYILDSVAFDLLHGGNKQSVMSGVYYYGFNGSSTVIANETTQTVAAYNFIKSIVGKVVTGVRVTATYQTTVAQTISASTATTSEVTTLTNAIDLITNIITNGPTAAPAKTPIALTANTGTRVVNGFNLLLANRAFIQAETIAYINQKYTFVYDQATCYRDIGYIVDCVSFDILYGGNRQAIQAGVYYYGFSNVSSAIPHERRKTSEAYDRLRDILSRVIESEPIVRSYGNTSTQDLLLTPATPAETAKLEGMIDLITNIITVGPSAAESKKAISLTKSTSTTVYNAVAILNSNRQFLIDEVTSYIDMINHPGVEYNEATCYRDTGLIVDAIAQDLLFGGTSQSTFAGIQYWRQADYVGAIAGEITTTTNAINHLSSLAQSVVRNINTNTASYQSIIPRILNTATAVSSATATLIGNDFSVITRILSSGTSGVTDTIIPNGVVASTATEIVNAVAALRANKQYLQAETIAWIDQTNSDILYYDQKKCTRDVGLIVDSLAFDLLHNGVSQSTFAGLQYWNQNGYTGQIGGELTTTSNAIAYLKDQILSRVGSTSSVSVSANFDKILYILNTGTSGVTDTIVPNGTTSTDIHIFNDYNTIIASKIGVSNAVVNWVITNNPGFAFNAFTCNRDVGYIMDSIAFDLLHGGNRQSVMSGVYYYNFNTTSSAIPNETTQTAYAYSFINSLSANIIQNIPVTATYQSYVGQVITANTATASEVATIDSLIYTINDIIVNGPTVAPAKTPIGLRASTTATVVNAFDLLLANRRFIQAETVAYISQTFNPFYYDRTICARDIGYMIDSISIDLLYGGNKQAVQSGVAYYAYINTSTVIPNEQIETIAAYAYIDNMARSIIFGQPLSQNYSTATQILSLNTGTDVESITVTHLVNTITNIILNGPSVAPPLVPLGVTASTNTSVVNAVGLLHANRAFIQAEVIGYINRVYPYLSLETCGRDINYILNSITYDLVYGGNSQAVVAGEAYYSGTQLTVESELDTIVEVYEFMSALTQDVALGNTVTPLQTSTSQNFTSGSCQLSDAQTIATLFDIINDILLDGYTITISTEETILINPPAGTKTTTHGYSLIVSTGHSFEWIGAGTNINSAFPYNGGEPISTNLAVEVNGGKVNFTGTDQRGDFRIGNDLVINRINGTISGRTFNKSLFAVMTPYILAIGG